jgi:hypothetical protein
MMNKPTGNMYPPQPKRLVRNKIHPPISIPLLIETRPKRVIRPVNARSTPLISSFRSSESFCQNEDTGTWRGAGLRVVRVVFELPRFADLPEREGVFRRDVVDLLLLLFERVEALPREREAGFLDLVDELVFLFWAISKL